MLLQRWTDSVVQSPS